MSAVVITGVSTGIGHASAKLFTQEGITVFGSVRSAADAARLQNEMGPLFHPLLFDITKENEVKAAAQVVRESLQGKTLWGLINNAGIAVQGAFFNLPVKDFQKQLDVNLTGQLIVTQAFLPLLGTDATLDGPPGKIINISSVSGKNAYPFMGAYAVSKHGLEAFSESLRRELMIFGIDVIIVGPGAIKTDIWDKARREPFPPGLDTSVYFKAAATLKEYMLSNAEKNGLPAETVASLLLKIMRDKHPKTRYALVPQKFISWTLPNFLPRRWVDWIIARKFGLLRKR
jgi:NAD(P)-dependent dehydrogenase (short-subunit alcohol dehydrogenase family)